MNDCFIFGISNPILLFVQILDYYKQVNVIVSSFYDVRSTRMPFCIVNLERF